MQSTILGLNYYEVNQEEKAKVNRSNSKLNSVSGMILTLEHCYNMV